MLTRIKMTSPVDEIGDDTSKAATEIDQSAIRNETARRIFLRVIALMAFTWGFILFVQNFFNFLNAFYWLGFLFLLYCVIAEPTARWRAVFAISFGALGFIIGSKTGLAHSGSAVNGGEVFPPIFGLIGYLIYPATYKPIEAAFKWIIGIKRL